ncbi:MAG: ATP-binding protein [Proteobacteria bacterium]|nr:ATP-binding protein [Pseudomonadota bacterium]MBU1569369.1 ATP-binding protein [Pseudomonadota bacterium]
MAQKVIQIPRLNDGASDFSELFSIWSQVNDYFEDVRFDFSGCHFLRPNAVAFLGGLARLIESRMGTVIFDWGTLHNFAVMTNLSQNGFAGYFGHPSSGWDGNSIPYRENKTLDMNGIMDYLTYNWIGKGWVHVSNRLRDVIAGKMWEIYNNAFEHSGTAIGVFSCGQHFPHNNTILLSVVDFGQGIPAKIRTFVGRDPRAQDLPAAACLRWAFTRGKSTSTEGVARGIGLDLLKEFIRINQGKLEVYSNEGYAIIDKDGERYENLDISFEGTVVHITLRRDENLYQLSDDSEAPF